MSFERNHNSQVNKYLLFAGWRQGIHRHWESARCLPREGPSKGAIVHRLQGRGWIPRIFLEQRVIELFWWQVYYARWLLIVNPDAAMRTVFLLFLFVSDYEMGVSCDSKWVDSMTYWEDFITKSYDSSQVQLCGWAFITRTEQYISCIFGDRINHLHRKVCTRVFIIRCPLKLIHCLLGLQLFPYSNRIIRRSHHMDMVNALPTTRECAQQPASSSRSLQLNSHISSCGLPPPLHLSCGPLYSWPPCHVVDWHPK